MNAVHRGSILTFTIICISVLTGCLQQRKVPTVDESYMNQQLLEISYPQLDDQSLNYSDNLSLEKPATVSDYKDLTPWELTLEEAIKKSLQNSEVVRRLGGQTLVSPQISVTNFDPAIAETDPRFGTEAALSAFDAQLNSSFFLSEDNQVAFNVANLSPVIASQARNFQAEVLKQAANGTSFALRNVSSARDNGQSIIPNTMNTLLQAEVRQPLRRGLGTDVTRIAGPNAQPGVYNGVLISRINTDISLADFESGIRDLVRDVERSYWELYFAYRDLDANLEARESARKVWVNRKARLDNGLGRPDEEALARQQYHSFEGSVQTALAGQPNSSLGVFGAERQLRTLMGIPTSDGSLIRPIDKPAVARVVPDWETGQGSALDRRVELRRQKWLVRRHELELIAARKLNKFNFDFVGQYGYRGIEAIAPNDRDLFGLFSTTNYNENWNVGLELSGPIGKRLYNLAERNAELKLAREKALLREQQRLVLLDLSEAYTEIDRAFASIKSNYNNLVAVEEELEPKRRRAEAGEEEIFFLLETQQRATRARTAFQRAIVDYNIALLNYAYSSGELLDRYQISLAEGPWGCDAYCKQNIRYNNLATHEDDYRWSEKRKVNQGTYLQQQEMYGMPVEEIPVDSTEAIESTDPQPEQKQTPEQPIDKPEPEAKGKEVRYRDIKPLKKISFGNASPTSAATTDLPATTNRSTPSDLEAPPASGSSAAISAWQAALQSGPSLQPKSATDFSRLLR